MPIPFIPCPHCGCNISDNCDCELLISGESELPESQFIANAIRRYEIDLQSGRNSDAISFIHELRLIHAGMQSELQCK